MRIVIVSPSREVNEAIANHTYLLADALRMQGAYEIEVIEIHKYKCDDGRYEATTFEHFTSLARSVNQTADVCLLQYHTNAYYGYDSRYILAFVNKLNVPLLTYCQSVINDPSPNQRSVVLSLASRSLKVFVKSQLSIDFLEHFYKVNPDQLIRLEYGVPIISDDGSASKLNGLNIKGKKVILSTGYLKPENGYETVINALPTILNHYPDFVYVIQGTTSLSEKELRGEGYRKSLQMLAKSRGVWDKVIFDNRSLTDEELMQVIQDAELYINTDINEQQLSNDALSLAVGAGSVVLSTPTWFAKSFLEDDRGQFFSFKSSSELAQLVVNTMRSASERSAYKEMTSLFGSQFSWDNLGARLLKIIVTSVNGVDTVETPKKRVILPELLPEWTPNHLLKMYDGTALLSSCFNDIVEYKKGYFLRENAMGVQVLAMASEGGIEDDLLKGCLSFIKYMENEDGSWSKGMEYNRAKKEGLYEFGEARTIWSLGSLFRRSKSAEIRDVAYSLFNKLIHQNNEPEEVLSKAAVIIGISHVLEGGFPDEELIDLVKKYANSILKLIPEDIVKWQWYEESLSKKYGLVPLALAYAHNVTGDNRFLSASRRTCRFIERLLFIDGVFNPAIQGHKKEDIKMVRGSNEQSSDEAFLMVACYSKLYQITREPLYLNQLSKTHLWYLGENNLRKSVYDQKDGACYQALGQRGVNPHKGIDSTCSYWLSHFTFMDAFFKELED